MRRQYNERSWAIDLIAEIKIWASKRDVTIKEAGGEHTLSNSKITRFPDVLLFGDSSSGQILQGWELKFPDTPINDNVFKANAKEKAGLLHLNTFLLWNVTQAELYVIEDDGTERLLMSWNNLSHITTRNQVEPAKEEWQAMLYEILESLSSFLNDGTIRKTSFVDSIAGEGIADLILRHSSETAKVLKVFRRTNIGFNDAVNIWWVSSKNAFPHENDCWNVLARINLISWLNKFIFAHVLKSYYESASAVESIVDGINADDAINIFSEISQKCDFWNIFSPQLGGKCLSEAAWQDLIALNLFLSELNFSGIEQTLLQKLLQNTVYRSKRKAAGQFTTPAHLAKLLVHLTVENKELCVSDPCCGTGTIARAAYEVKRDFGIASSDALSKIWASDKFSFPLQMATLSLSEPENIGSILNVFLKDATCLSTGDEIDLHDPQDGHVKKTPFPPVDYFVSNLPFVQQEDLRTLNPNIGNINGFLTNMSGKPGLDSRSDLYAYLPFYLWSLLSEGGGIGIIISNSWLATGWGKKFRELLSSFFNIEFVIVSAHSRWFEEADVVTNILILRKKSDDQVRAQLDDQEERTRFVTINCSLFQGQNDDTIGHLASCIRANTPNPDISQNAYTKAMIGSLEHLGVSWNAFFADCNWLTSISNKLIKANTLFEIKRGERRGWDRMFYPEANHPIESDYIAPVLRSSRSIDKLIAGTDGIAFCCDKSTEELNGLGHTGALQWIQLFENRTNTDGKPLPEVLARAGTNWYTMLPETMGDLVTSMNPNDRLFIAKLNQRSFVNQRLIRFTCKSGFAIQNIDLCHALLNSILGMFYIEALGFGRSLGVLDLSSTKLNKGLFLLDPSLLEPEQINAIRKAFLKVSQRPVLPLIEELSQPDRQLFDETVLEAYGIEHIGSEIEQALLKLYQIRKSVR